MQRAKTSLLTFFLVPVLIFASPVDDQPYQQKNFATRLVGVQ